MQNRLVDYVDGKSQSQTYFKSFSTLQKCLLISIPYHGFAHGMLYVYWTFSIGGKYGLGAAQSSWSWTFESTSGSSTFHINLRRALLVHTPALGYQMLRGKRKSEYLAQVKVAIFILEIKPCSLLPFPAQKRHFKRGNYRKQTNFT